MLFLIYWELNDELPYSDRMRIAKKMTESEMFPPDNVRIIRWDTTPDNWGITLVEAESVSDVTHALNLWRAAAPGFFKLTKTAPAIPAEEAIAQGVELVNEVEGIDVTLISHN